MVNIVLGVIGADCHAVGNKILEIAFRDAGFAVHNLGVMVPQEEFIAAAIETNAEALLISSLCGHAEIDCRGLRERCMEAGIGKILLYLGGNLTVGESDFAEVEEKFTAMGFDRVFPPGTMPEDGIDALHADLRKRGVEISDA
ncbi:MAG: methylaspartate mutase subunit S [Actinobacteria bacterium]|nr:methylaspartate mutase subunit S [Actinomycetota bacterium]OPZ79827.1 MAG: Methylaspartate mutase S chain [Actinobacteria bacterium ADurb.Bin444]